MERNPHGSTVLPAPSQFPTTEKKGRKKQRTSLFSSLFRTINPAKSEGKRNIWPAALAVVLWGGLIYGGYLYANLTLERNQQYIDAKINEIKSTNMEQMKVMEDQVVSVQEEMKTVQDGLAAITEELQLTGKTIGGTNQTKQALTERIDQLNKQLVELKASLKKLEDAARAW